jgi:hypothetical protein
MATSSRFTTLGRAGAPWGHAAVEDKVGAAQDAGPRLAKGAGLSLPASKRARKQL